MRVIRDERGSAAAEFAVALPAALLVLLLTIGAGTAQAQRIALQDAVADAARLIARGDDPARAGSLVDRATAGATMSVANDGDLVCVTAHATSRVVPSVPIAWSVSACALSESVLSERGSEP